MRLSWRGQPSHKNKANKYYSSLARGWLKFLQYCILGKNGAVRSQRRSLVIFLLLL
jgi:hypothetical protein